ncbi:hypothetical protein [Pseudomonas sp. G2-4]|uniref:hypothetical protein n=1 Tax=Pseudomonas sp. G2-4 TaxID=1506334 RepID=UPI0024BB18B6|nr:hypothetical protein [Pseudomonas sp. G2-4]WHS61373.1 hypothetical protein QNH97_04840 [Pseudomonas sp. G2-4]
MNFYLFFIFFLAGLNFIYASGIAFAQESVSPAASLDSKDPRVINQVQAAGTYEDPRGWADLTVPGAIHKGSTGFFESRFLGSALIGGKPFPPAGQDNDSWFWRGRHAGLYSDPKNWGDWSYPSAIHKGDNGYYESRFNGSAATSNLYFPPTGQNNDYWHWLGAHIGTFTDPKSWSEQTRPGAIHKGDSGFFESRFTGSAAAANKYFPPAGQDNNNWFWRGAHAGTFQDPKSWREFSYIGAIHGAGNSKRLESKFNGVAGPTDYYPTNNQDNAWWKVRAIDCPINALAAAPSHFAEKQKHIPGAQIDMTALVTESSTRTSPLLQGLTLVNFSPWHREENYEVASAMLMNERRDKVGSISVVLNKEGSFYALVESPTFRGTIHSNIKGEQTLTPEKPHDYMEPDTVKPDTMDLNEQMITTENQDVDCNGTNIVDVMAGFSQAAVNQIGGWTSAVEFARLEIETANVGLRNSRVKNVRLRFVGIAIVPEDFPMNGETLSRLSTLFAPEAQAVGADMIAGFAREGRGGGIAYLDWRYSLQAIDSPTAYRHEVGHNAGGDHCNTGGTDDYKFGYNNGSSRTFLCGNSSPYYSTPRVSDSGGRPLGNARTADMARLWQERAIKMSSYQKAPSPISGVFP